MSNMQGWVGARLCRNVGSPAPTYIGQNWAKCLIFSWWGEYSTSRVLVRVWGLSWPRSARGWGGACPPVQGYGFPGGIWGPMEARLDVWAQVGSWAKEFWADRGCLRPSRIWTDKCRCVEMGLYVGPNLTLQICGQASTKTVNIKQI